MFQSSSTCAAAHASSVGEPARRERQRQQRRAGQRGDDIERAEPPGSPRCRRRSGSPRPPPRSPPPAAPHARCPRPARSARRASRAPNRHRVPMAALACRPARPARRRDRTADRCRDISRSRPRPAAGAGATPSMIELASRVSGIAAGSTLSCCASHSAASACGQGAHRRGQVAAAPASAPAGRRAGPQSRPAPRRPSPPGRTAPAGSGACCAARTPSDRAAGSRKSPRRCRASVSRPDLCDAT